MTVDPRISLWLNVALTILIGISTGAVSLTNVLGPADASRAVAWCGLVAFILGAINTALHGLSNTVAGRLVAAKALPEVQQIDIDPKATGIAADMARDPSEPKVAVAPPLPLGAARTSG